jgi:hypothetical protein
VATNSSGVTPPETYGYIDLPEHIADDAETLGA